MTHQLSADGSPDELLPETVPDDSELPESRCHHKIEHQEKTMTNEHHPVPGPPQGQVPKHRMGIEKDRARVRTIRLERDLWRSRAEENQLTIQRLKAEIRRLRGEPMEGPDHDEH